jgi:cyclopropane fatty-acyl-phospholipid synthase-like methyltransferase
MNLKIETSEYWHSDKYGSPERCWESYLASFKDSDYEVNQHLNYYLENYDKVDDKHKKAISGKQSLLASFFAFEKCKNVLDIGGGCGTTAALLKKNYANIESVLVLEGNSHSSSYVKSYLPDGVEVRHCDFYKDLQSLDIKRTFDAIFQFDIAEHLPDSLYIALTKKIINYLEPGGKLFIYTPEFPYAVDQEEHISVKSVGFFLYVLLGLGLTIEKLASISNRILIQTEKGK